MAKNLPVFYVDRSSGKHATGRIKRRILGRRTSPSPRPRVRKEKAVQGTGRQIVMGFAIIALGVAVAWCFRQGTTSWTVDGTARPMSGQTQLSSDNGPLLLHVPPVAAGGNGNSTSSTSYVRAGLPNTAPPTPVQPRTPLDNPRREDGPPLIEKQYGQLSQRLAPLNWTDTARTTDANDSLLPRRSNPVTGLPVSDDRSVVPEPALPASRNVVSKPVRGSSAMRTHTVRDRDTLDSIAQRYYGNAALAWKILAANRELISNPQLLPVGAQLAIPDPDTPLVATQLTPLDRGSSEGHLARVTGTTNDSSHSSESDSNPPSIRPIRRPVTRLVPLESANP